MPKKFLFWGYGGAVQLGLALSQCAERLDQQHVHVSGCKAGGRDAQVIPILPPRAG